MPKINNLENLGLSIEKVINNILEEIELSHEQMFKILESLAVLDQEKLHFRGSGTKTSSNDDTSSQDSHFSNFEYNHQQKEEEEEEKKGEKLQDQITQLQEELKEERPSFKKKKQKAA